MNLFDETRNFIDIILPYIENVAHLSVYFEENCFAHFHVNWLSPVKVRKTLVAGNKKMLVWDDLQSDEKIKIYDKGVEITTAEGIYDMLPQYRSDDMYCPKIQRFVTVREKPMNTKCIDLKLDMNSPKQRVDGKMQ